MGIFGIVKDRVAQYVNVQLDLLKISVIERTASIAGYAVFWLIALPLLASIFLLAGFGLSEWFIELIGSRPLGYLCGSGAMLLLLIFFFVLRRIVVRRVGGSIIRSLSERAEELTDDEPYPKKAGK